jgi:hypothetical protein
MVMMMNDADNHERALEERRAKAAIIAHVKKMTGEVRLRWKRTFGRSPGGSYEVEGTHRRMPKAYPFSVILIYSPFSGVSVEYPC